MTPRKKTEGDSKPPASKKATTKKPKAVSAAGKKAADNSAAVPGSKAKPETTPINEVPQEIVEVPVPVEVPQDDAVPAGVGQITNAQATGEAPMGENVLAPAIDKMVVFLLADQRYSIAITSVQEIQQIVAFSDVPSTGQGLVGMVNLRGNVIPALDIRLLLGMPPLQYHLDTPMVICRSHDQLVALIVDEVEDVVALPEGCLAAPPQMHGLADRMIGVCRMENHLVYLLDVDRLLAPASIVGGGH